MAKFDPFLSLDCARVEGMGAHSKERKGSNFAAQRSGAIVQKLEGPNTYDSKNLAIAIWQPCFWQTKYLKVIWYFTTLIIVLAVLLTTVLLMYVLASLPKVDLEDDHNHKSTSLCTFYR